MAARIERRAAIGALLAALAGCVEGPGGAPLPAAGIEAFAAEAQPVLAARCANPSCHGNPWRPLALYAVRRHRLDPADTHLEAPLTEAELRLNLLHTLGLLATADDPADSLLLRKPLAVGAGGVAHAGGAQFADPLSHDYQRLLRWARGAVADGSHDPFEARRTR